DRHRLGVDIDTDAGELRAWVEGPRHEEHTVVNLPETFAPEAFTAVTIEIGADGLQAQLTESRLGDPLAQVQVELPDPLPRQNLALSAIDDAVQVDNLSVTAAHEPVVEAVPAPQAGDALFTEDLDDELAP